MKVEFFFPLEEIPRTSAQEKGVRIVRGRPVFYTKDKVQEVAKLYDFMINQNRPKRKLTGAVRVNVCFYYPVKKPHKNGDPKITRPDVDNMAKLLIDRVTKSGTFWEDDSQISDLRIIKAYAEPSGIGLQVIEIGNGGLERDD